MAYYLLPRPPMSHLPGHGEIEAYMARQSTPQSSSRPSGNDRVKSETRTRPNQARKSSDRV
jgi:hypothetical protein